MNGLRAPPRSFGPIGGRRRRGGTAVRVLPWLVAAAGFALTLALAWPGWLTFDSAHQWAQARGALPLDPQHPPVMVRVWSALRLVLPDPGGMLAVQAALWWGALALLAQALGGGTVRRVVTVLVLGLWPATFAVLPHLWKDVWLCALLMLAVAAAAADVRRPQAGWRWLAVLAIALAAAFRANAWPAVLPLLAWLAWRSGRRGGAIVVATVLMAGVAVGASLWLNRVPAPARSPVWPTLALWDLAAVSVAEERIVVPPAWIDPATTVGDLRAEFMPWVNVPSFANGRLRLNPYFEHPPEDYAALREAWLRLPVTHPRAYFAHRARVTGYLLGFDRDEHPDSLVIAPGIVAFPANPPLRANDGPVARAVVPRLQALVDTPLLAPWPYLLLATLGALRWAVRRDGGLPGLGGAVALSSLALAAPLAVIAPSSDYRYLLWSVMAALLAAALVFAAPERRR